LKIQNQSLSKAWALIARSSRAMSEVKDSMVYITTA